jgi:hypothetical protein
MDSVSFYGMNSYEFQVSRQYNEVKSKKTQIGRKQQGIKGIISTAT